MIYPLVIQHIENRPGEIVSLSIKNGGSLTIAILVITKGYRIDSISLSDQSDGMFLAHDLLCQAFKMLGCFARFIQSLTPSGAGGANAETGS